MIILETTQLVLKTIEKEDSQVLHDLIFSDEEIMRNTLSHKAFTLDETKKFIYKNFCKNHAIIGLASLFEKRSGQIIGVAGVLENKELGVDSFEIYCIIAKDFQDNSYATEVLQAELTFVKKRLKKNKAFMLINKEDSTLKELLLNHKMSFEKTMTCIEKGEKEVYSKKL